MKTILRPIRSARPHDRAAWSKLVACEVRELTAELGGSGWTFAEIAAAVDVSEGSLRNYRTGQDEPKARVLEALRALCELEMGKVGVR